MCKCHKYNRETKKFERVYNTVFKLNAGNPNELFKFDYADSDVFQIEKKPNNQESICRNQRTFEVGTYHNSASIIFIPNK